MDAAALIKNADTAMYHAKERGRNNYQFFRHDMNTRAMERQLVESNLRRALERGEFTLHYQPKVDLESDRITGVEALLRWEHPEWGLVLPERFISIAEECGLIVPIGRWVLREACAGGALAMTPAFRRCRSRSTYRPWNFVIGIFSITCSRSSPKPAWTRPACSSN
jgi:predicted signal transduction protein with EAL and GGDEF domain